MTADIGEQIARDLYRRFGHEIPAAFDLTDGHCKTFMRTGLVTGGTTSLEDCMLLYLLVRGYGCKHVFEIGTYIGTSTVAMNEAVRRNGGICTTSDPVIIARCPRTAVSASSTNARQSRCRFCNRRRAGLTSASWIGYPKTQP